MASCINEAYTWHAVYWDGCAFCEFDEVNTVGHGFAEVDSARVKSLRLEPVLSSLPSRHIDIPEGATPIFFRRRTLTINPNADEDTPERTTVHCIGWQCDDEAEYLFVFDDGDTLLTDNFHAVSC